MRAAQAQLDAAAMAELRSERDLLLGTWAVDADVAGRRAGRALTSAVGEEVRATLIAALAEEEATQAVLSGHLTRALSYSGFGGVDLSEAVVRTSSGAVLSVVPGAAREEKAPRTKAAEAKDTADEATAAREAAQRERVDAARETHEAAVEAAKEAKQALDQARDRSDETRWRVEELEHQLKQARAEHRAAEQAATEAARARRSAEVEVARAEKALRDARARRE
jgi:hypothetical protein